MSQDHEGVKARLGRVGVFQGALLRAPAEEARRFAARVEELGYGALWFGEGAATKEAFTHAGLLLAATERLAVGTGIANIWVRDATAANAAALTLAEAHGGRFVLGLGASHAPQVEVRGHTYEKPLAAMRSYLDGLDAAEFHAALPPTGPPPRVLAALGPKMLGLAAERAAGALTYCVTPEHTASAREAMGGGALLAVEQAVVLESDPAKAREAARAHLAFYLGFPNYTRNLRRYGFSEDDFADGGSDALVDSLVAWGDEETVRRRVAAHHKAGADHVAVQPLVAPGEGDLGAGQLAELGAALL
ncbi:TIGR03620 family F420-dependent LLM class oxidoreductase [Streptomyces sp. ODS28]|uniref:TIGR03620 family F420-dependent LLM class oxidoreductase n=1 Tax=Streptomyces sp. ODS28 TaxID=3136688 RepID=UPI0031F10054